MSTIIQKKKRKKEIEIKTKTQYRDWNNEYIEWTHGRVAGYGIYPTH